jgi:transposase
MNRPVPFAPLTVEQIVELQRLLRSHSLPRALRKRAELVWHLAAGGTLTKASERAGLTYANAHRCMRRFLKLGIAGLYDRARTGRTRRYGPLETNRILQLAATPPRHLGLDLNTWSLPHLEEYLRGQEGFEHVARSTIRRRLIEARLQFHGGQLDTKRQT